MDVAPLDWRPDSAFVQAGDSVRDSWVAGVGMRWNAPWPSNAWGPGWRGAVDVTLSLWSASVVSRVAHNEHVRQWALLPTMRWQPQEGRSPWFVEAGLGVSLHDRRYRVERVEQSSRWNFQEVLALGRSLGMQRQQEVSLSLAHVSNAGLRHPNPGETWWALRWSFAF